MVGFSGRGRWRGGGGCGGPWGGRKSAYFRPSSKKWAKITPLLLSPISSSPHIPQSGQGGRPAGRPVGQPVFSRRPARFSAWLAGWPAGRLAVAARPGQPAAPLPSRRLTRARPATPLETRPAAGHIRAGLNSSRPSPPAARLAGSAERLPGSAERSRADLAASRIWASAGRVAGRICPAARPDLGLGRPGGRPDFSGGPARIVGRPDLGGRPAGFGGSAGRFWGVGWPGRPAPLTAQPLTGRRFLLYRSVV